MSFVSERTGCYHDPAVREAKYRVCETEQTLRDQLSAYVSMR